MPATAPAPSLIEVLRSNSSGALQRLVSDDVTFSSPFADYHGRADVVHLLALIARVLREPVATSTATDDCSRFTALTARVDGHDVEGVLRERHDDEGRLVHATLFLRPYATLQVAIGAMGRLLADAPLPSTLTRASSRSSTRGTNPIRPDFGL